jgi:signal transduction histidine kinase
VSGFLRTDPLIAAALAVAAGLQAFVFQVSALSIAIAVAAALFALRLAMTGRAARREAAALEAELARERERSSRLPALDERARVARELRSIIAGALRDLAGAAPRTTASDALAELERLLAVLGPDEGDEGEDVGLAQLPALVERARAAGMPVTLHIEGTPRRVHASLDRSAYRIVQEALVNAHRHAPGEPASVRVIWRRDVLGLQVRNTGANGDRPRGEGHGLERMRERARAHGGELRAGPLPSGGFDVTAKLPL